MKPRYIDNNNTGDYNCGCGKSFKTSATLKFHISSAHNGVVPNINANNNFNIPNIMLPINNAPNNFNGQIQYNNQPPQYNNRQGFDSVLFLNMMEFQIKTLSGSENQVEDDLKNLLNTIFGELYQMFDTLSMKQKGFLYFKLISLMKYS